MPDQILSSVPVSVEPHVDHFLFIKKHMVLLLCFVVTLSLVMTGVLGYLYLSRDQKAVEKQSVVMFGNATVSGNFDINGPIPQSATITVLARQVGASDFNVIARSLTAVDGGAWSWTGAKTGDPYEIQGILNADGGVSVKSGVITIVAPADGERLKFSIASVPSKTQTTLSGIVNLNGFIPQGATLTLSSQAQGQSGFTSFASGLPAADGASWSLPTALSGQSYSVQASLVQNGVVISTSTPLQIIAPATGEVLTINSTATPPVPATTTVSGSINLNGVAVSGSSISVGARITGTTTFTTFASNISPSDGVSWSYPSAISGQSYDFQAYLVSNGSTINQSQVLTVAAPASGEVLTINAQTQPQAPQTNSMTNTCVSQNSSTNLWQVQISFNTNNAVPSAQQYLLTIGNTQGGTQMLSNTASPVNGNNPGGTQTYTTGFLFTTGQTYYAQWAYATCSNCNTFSSFSPTMQFYCTAPAPTNTPSPTSTPTNTPVPSATPLPTSTPLPPTNTPTPPPPTSTPTS